MSFSDLNPVAVGITTVVLAIAASTFAFAVGSVGILDDTYSMSGVFTESGGIRSGDRVRYAGVEIGRVTDVRPDFDEGWVVVTWEVDAGSDIGNRAEAEISLATLLGGRYLRISGPLDEPYMEDLDVEDRRIPLERTRVPLGVTEALGQATSTIDAIDATAVDELVNQLADLATDNADSFEPLLEDVSALTEVLNSRRGTIDALLDETTKLTDSLAQKDEALIRLIDQAGSLLDQVASRRDQLSTLLGSGSATVQELDSLISRNQESLDTVLRNLHTTTEGLEPSLPAFNETLAVLGPTMTGIESATITGDWADIILTGVGLLQLGDLLEASL